MWHIITPFLYLTCIEAYNINAPYQPREPPQSYPIPAVYHQPARYPITYQNTYANANAKAVSGVRPMNGMPGYYLRNNDNNLRESDTLSKSFYIGNDAFQFDGDYDSNGISDMNISDTDPVLESRFKETSSYYEDMELVDSFANYLRRRTVIDRKYSNSPNSPAHQYNALLAVLLSLARFIRSSCVDFDRIYDQLYFQTSDNFFKIGMVNSDKVPALMEYYIQRGQAHMPKLRKIRQEICDKELFCSVSVDNRIKSSLLVYVKELENLKALTHLARSFYTYIDEFDLAAQKGAVHIYLQRSKDRLKEYILHLVNSIEHLSEKPVTC